jgi:hypothetical protein
MTMLGKLSKLFQKTPAPGPRVSLAAFGKHPGWDDHIDDIGLDSPRLVHVKSVLYSQGISGNIDSAGWDQISETERLPEFAHEFLWRWAGDAVVGVMWSSRDGKGRTKYPMVLCLHGTGVPIGWLCSTGLERLRALRDHCKTLGTAAEVIRVLDSARLDLQGAVLSVPLGDNEPERHLIKRLMANHEQAARNGFVRVLYDIERRLGGMRVDKHKTKTRVIDLSAHHFRLPAISGAGKVLESGRAWSALMMDSVGAGPVLSAGILAIEPAGTGFTDVVVGDPSVQTLFCLRASGVREPLTSDIPFTIDEGFVTAASQQISQWSA